MNSRRSLRGSSLVALVLAATMSSVPLSAHAASGSDTTLAGPAVFRTYSGPGGLQAELQEDAARYPGIADVVTIGHSVRGVPIQALKVTKDAAHRADGRRPAVLYLGAQHAREWITPEMVRRLMNQVLTGYGQDPTWTKLVNTTELWFLPVANPDGYDYSFTPGHREWRKNLRDNDGDGQITDVDGVDLNRNFDEHWGYDNEGSSPDPSDDTYRGPKAASEPETRALSALLDRVNFRFMVNYHSAAEVMMYGNGWQVNTTEPDDQIAQALIGDATTPAVPGYRPRRFAESSTSNGDSAMYAQRSGTIGLGIEMSSCYTVSDMDPDDRWNPADCESEFDFPDDEKLIQAEYAKNLPLARAVARSAVDPAAPVSPVGRAAAPLVPTVFGVSYGSDQVVAVTARRSLKNLRLHYRINRGPERTAAVAEWTGGERYGDRGRTYYGQFRATVAGQHPDDRVSVWFSADATAATTPFSYTVNHRIGGDVLVLAAEDVNGVNPPSTDGAVSARYVQQHVDALARAGRRADVYDLDRHDGQPPSPLGVLSHYRVVLWETGDNVLPQVPGQEFYMTTDVPARTELAVRDYLNEGGTLILSGQHADATGAPDSFHIYPPAGTGPCTEALDEHCLRTSDDFQQYWLGVGEYLPYAGVPGTVTGTGGAFAGLHMSLGRQDQTVSFRPISTLVPAATFPQFEGSVPMRWQLTCNGDPDTDPPADSGPGVVTSRSVFLGFGLERLSPADRERVVARALEHLDG
jgi:hypothetical protein